MKNIRQMVTKILPYARFNVQVPSPLSEVFQRLSSQVALGDIEQGFRLRLPYYGQVTEKGFSIRPAIHEQRSRQQPLGPNITGSFEALSEGTLVRITISPQPVVYILFGMFILGWYSFYGFFLSLTPGINLFFVIAPIISIFLMWFDLLYEVGRAKKDLSLILVGQPRSSQSVKWTSVLKYSVGISIGLLAFFFILTQHETGIFNLPMPISSQRETPYLNLKLTHQIELPERTRAIAISPDSQTLVSGGDENILRVWDIETGKQIQTLPNEELGIVQFLEFGADNDTVISASKDKGIRVWDLKTGKPTAQFTQAQGDIFDLAIAANGQTLMSTSWNGKFSAWDIKSGKSITVPSTQSDQLSWPFSIFVSSPSSQIRDIELSVNGETAAIVGDQLQFLGLDTGKPDTHIQKSFDQSINAVKYSADGRTLVTMNSRTLKVWDLKGQKYISKISLSNDANFFGDLFLSRNGRYAMTQVIQDIPRRGVADRLYFQIWDLKTQQLAVVQPITGYVLNFSPDGKTIVNTGGNIIRIWNSNDIE